MTCGLKAQDRFFFIRGVRTSHLYGPSPTKAIRASGRLSITLPKAISALSALLHQ